MPQAQMNGRVFFMLSGPVLYRTEAHAATGSIGTRAHTHAHIHTCLDYNKRKIWRLGLSKNLQFSSPTDFDQMFVESKMWKVNNF